MPGTATDMRRFTLLTIALCSAVSFLLGAVLSGRSAAASAAAKVAAAAGSDARTQPAAARASARAPIPAPGVVNFADVAERINPAVVNIDAASRAGREARR